MAEPGIRVGNIHLTVSEREQPIVMFFEFVTCCPNEKDIALAMRHCYRVLMD